MEIFGISPAWKYRQNYSAKTGSKRATGSNSPQPFTAIAALTAWTGKGGSHAIELGLSTVCVRRLGSGAEAGNEVPGGLADRLSIRTDRRQIHRPLGRGSASI